MQHKLISLLFCSALIALAADTHTVSGNFPRDLYGPVDIRDTRCVCAGGPCIWGHADSDSADIVFYPEPGYRVRILMIRGDLVSWVKTQPGDPATPVESTAGTLAGFATPTSNASVNCNYCADDTVVYIQDSVSDRFPNSRASFSYDNIDLVLGTDNALNMKVAAWLNTTGKPIHLELTYTIKFVYEPIPAQVTPSGEFRKPTLVAKSR